jgi:2'-5' RNA ligase
MATVVHSDRTKSADTSRLFLAIDAPERVCHLIAALGTPIAGIAWTPPERLHLTLRFLGATPTERIPALCERLRALRVAPFILPVEGIGVFPPRGQPRILWCGVGQGLPHLRQLRQRVDDALQALGLESDMEGFVPHFTLARVSTAAPAAIAQWRHLHREFAAPPFQVDRFALYASELQPTGAVHRLLESFPLLAH